MEKLTLENFRAYKDKATIEFAPITIFTGKNNSGKSTIFKAILLLSDFLNSENQLELEFDGPLAHKHKIDCMLNAITWGSNLKTFELTFEKEGFVFSFFFGEGNKNGVLQKALFIHSDTKSRIIVERLSQTQLAFEVDESFLDSFNQTSHESLENDIDNLSKTIAQYEFELKEIEEKIRLEPIGSKDSILMTDQKNQLAERIKTTQKRTTELKLEFKQKVKPKTNVFKQTFNLVEENGYSLTIISLMRRFLSRYFSSEEFKNEFGFVDLNKSRSILYNFPERLKSVLSFEAHHLGPNRTHQARLYLNHDRNMEINEIMAEYAHKTPPKGSVSHQFLIKWMTEFEIGTDVRVQDVQATASYLEIFIQDRWQNLTDKGFGAGQVLTILIKICNEIQNSTSQLYSFKNASRQSPPIIMIEEPETNLHPHLQSRLADMFYDAYKSFGIHFILETHSEYFIRRYKLLVAKDEIDPRDILIYYIFGSGEEQLRRLEILENGKLSGSFGEDFFDLADAIELELYSVNRKKGN